MAEAQISFGGWVARARRIQDLTQQELADRVGCSASALRKIEADERRPSRELAALLADALQIPAEQRPAFLKVARRELLVERLGAPPASTAAAAAPAVAASPAPQPGAPATGAPPVGREHELSTLATLLGDGECRLVTLVGQGGIGKTRLALYVAEHIAPAYPDGVCVVEFAGLSAPELIAQTIANALDSAPHAADAAAARAHLLAALRSRRLLLVLDNLEHLLAGVGLLADILEQTAHVQIIATSRERLNLHGEWVFEVQGLPMPPEAVLHGQSGAASVAEELSQYSAAQLFLQSARRAQVGFAPSSADRAAIVRICHLVDGMPLALELAAGWVRTLSCAEIAAEIERDIHFLATNTRDTPARHRSLAAVFDYSWGLLDAREQRALAALALFRGGFAREAAQAVAGASLSLLSSLVDRSLVRRSSPHRYEMHELVRQYCAARLEQGDALEPTRTAFCRCYRDLVVEAISHLVGAEQRTWLDRMEIELNNLRAALTFCRDRADDTLGLEIASGLTGYWYQRDVQSEGLLWIHTFLDRAASLDPLLEARARHNAGYLAYEMGDFDAARGDLERGLELARAHDSAEIAMGILSVLGQIYGAQGRFAAARAALEQVLAMPHETTYAARRRAAALMALGDVTSLTGDDERAQFLFAASAAIYGELEDQNALAYANRKWAWSALARGDLPLAERLATESLRLNQVTGSRIGVVAALACLGALRTAQGRDDEALHLLSAVDGLIALHTLALRPSDRGRYAQAVAQLHARTSPAAQAAALPARAWAQEQAIEYALRAHAARPATGGATGDRASSARPQRDLV